MLEAADLWSPWPSWTQPTTNADLNPNPDPTAPFSKLYGFDMKCHEFAMEFIYVM